MKLSISILQVEQVTQSYVDWYANDKVIQFSENQYGNFSFDGQCSYVESCLQSNEMNLYGIFDDTTHIGNIVLNGLNSAHQKAELTYVIGATSYWGKGVASFAVAKIIEIARTEFDLNKLYAGIASSNINSGKVLKKNGFILEGTRKKHLFYCGEFFDQLDYGLLL